jgi:hypothetical protein
MDQAIRDGVNHGNMVASVQKKQGHPSITGDDGISQNLNHVDYHQHS